MHTEKTSNMVMAPKVPSLITIVLVLSLIMQLAHHSLLSKTSSSTLSRLPSPPSIRMLKAVNLREDILTAQMLILYLQAFDRQSGISLRFEELDYEGVTDWLDTALKLDKSSQYPLLLASFVYSQVPNKLKQRQMLDFVYTSFFFDTAHRWMWLAHASIIAKHRLKDLPLALRYAKAVTDNTRGKSVPGWVKQMPIFILQDMGELESANLLLDALLESGEVSPEEAFFLRQRYQAK